MRYVEICIHQRKPIIRLALLVEGRIPETTDSCLRGKVSHWKIETMFRIP